MSHSTNAPRLIDTATGRVLVDLWGEDWDAVVSWPGHDLAQLELRRYGGPGACTLLIDAAAQTYRIGAYGDPQPLAHAKAAIVQAFISRPDGSEERNWWSRPATYRMRWANVRELGWVIVGPFMVPAGLFLIGHSVLQWAMPGCCERVVRTSLYEQFGDSGVAIIGVLLGLGSIAIGTYAFRAARWAWQSSRRGPV